MTTVTRRAYIKLTVVVIELELIPLASAANMEDVVKASGHSLLSNSAFELFPQFVVAALLLLAPLPLFPIAPIAVGK